VLSEEFKNLRPSKKIASMIFIFAHVSYWILAVISVSLEVPEPIVRVGKIVIISVMYIDLIYISVITIVESLRLKGSKLYRRLSIVYYVCELVYLIGILAIFLAIRDSTTLEYGYIIIMPMILIFLILSTFLRHLKEKEDVIQEAQERARKREEQGKIAKEIFDVSGMKGIFEYNKSEKDNKIENPFDCLSQKYAMLQKEYAGSFYELSRGIKSKTYRLEYAKGGESYHRGFYFPGVSDLTLISRDRGRLMNSPPEDKNYNYEYLFDDRDKLICVYKYGEIDRRQKLLSTELFVYGDNKVLSFGFDTADDNSISFISECQYENGLLALYEFARRATRYGEEDCYEIDMEMYGYTDALLDAFYWYRFDPSVQVLSQEKYTFFRDEEGYLSTFIVEKLDGFEPKLGISRGKTPREVSDKRK